MFTTVDQVALKYGIKNQMKIRELLRTGAIKGTKVRGQWLVDAESAETYFSRSQVRAARVEKTQEDGLVVATGLSFVAYHNRTRKRALFTDGNGEWWTNAVHGGKTGQLHLQSNWRKELTGETLREMFYFAFGVVIPERDTIHITPGHPKAVSDRQAAELAEHNIVIEGNWSGSTWTSWKKTPGTLVVSASRSRVCEWWTSH